MRRIILTLMMLATGLCTALAAGNDEVRARKILDQTAAKLKAMKGMTIDFTIAQYQGKKLQGTGDGQIDLLDKRFHVTTTDMVSWFDGKNQWSMVPGDSEANLTAPTPEEQQAMNPYAFLSLYKSGYSLECSRTKLSNGTEGWKILMKAKSAKQQLSRIQVEIDRTYTPVRVTLQQGKTQTVRINVKKLQGNRSFPADHFTFPTKQYPHVEIIDLR